MRLIILEKKNCQKNMLKSFKGVIQIKLYPLQGKKVVSTIIYVVEDILMLMQKKIIDKQFYTATFRSSLGQNDIVNIVLTC